MTTPPDASVSAGSPPCVLEHDVELYFSGNPYERENRLIGDRYADYVLKVCAGCESFLELGIGFGKTVERLSREIARLTVIDAEPRLINACRTLYPNVVFEETFFEDFVAGEAFEGIGMGFVLDLVGNPKELLRQYAGYLQPGGRLFVCVENALSLHRLVAHEAGLLPELKRMSDYNRAYGHRCYNTHEEWLALFTQVGFRCQASLGLYLKPFSTRQLEDLSLSEEVFTALSRVARDHPGISNAVLYVLEG